jgi:phosphate transport system substrate-binding protein
MDFPFTTEAKPAFPWTYVPIVGGPVVIGYNVPGLNLKLDATTISSIFKGKITKWNAPQIAKLNKGAKLPSKDISLIVRSSSSGTTQNFAAFLKDQAPKDNWNTNGVFATASGNSKITGTGSNSLAIAAVKSTPYSITYADLADTLTGGVQLAAVKNGKGQYVKPSVASAGKFLAAQEMSKVTGIVRYDYDKEISGGYNLSLFSYIAAPTSKGTANADATRTWIQNFLGTCSPAKSPTVGYVPLSGNALTIAKSLAAKVG